MFGFCFLVFGGDDFCQNFRFLDGSGVGLLVIYKGWKGLGKKDWIYGLFGFEC